MEAFNEFLGTWDEDSFGVNEEGKILKSFHNILRREEPNAYLYQLHQLLKARPEDQHFGFYVDSKDLLADDPLLGHLLFRFPGIMIKLFSKALVEEQERLMKAAIPARRATWSIKRNVHARVEWLPRAHRKVNISSIKSQDVYTFIQVSGTVTRCGAIKVLEAVRVFECNNERCAGSIRVFAALNEAGGLIQKPSGQCPNCKRSSSYTEVKSDSVCRDFQEIRMQEQVQKLGMGSIPRSINVLILDDLVDSIKAGDDIVITGVPTHRWFKTYVEERCNLETVIIANTIHVANSAAESNVRLTDELVAEFEGYWRKWDDLEKPLRGRNEIVRCMCPQLYGLSTIKLSVTLALIGSVSFTNKEVGIDDLSVAVVISMNQGTRVRGDPHLLLVGDPGTGKSQFLRFACKLSQRSVLTTGGGTTSAGLTCAAVKEGSEYMLEAGALVLADRGVCCIDEFGQIREHDRATIHEAMEQQTLSVAKAGLVCTLNTRCTIIAATNPKGNYDIDADLSTNVGIASPLLSRFDIVLVMLDAPEKQWDKAVSAHILKAQMDEKEDDLESEQPEGSAPYRSSNQTGMWDPEKFQIYLTYAKRFQPVLGPHAAKVLTTYYAKQRRSDNSCGPVEAGRITLRLLESLIRISKAHARLMGSDYVTITDAVVAISLIKMSMMMQCAVGEDSVLHKDFPEDPDLDFEKTRTTVLKELGLHDLVGLREDRYASDVDDA